MMTLERSFSNTTFSGDNVTTTTVFADSQYYTLPNTPRSSVSSSPLKTHRNGINGAHIHRVLNRTISNGTYASVGSSTTGFSNTAWASTDSVDHSKGKRSRFRSSNNTPDRLKPHHQSSNPHAYRNGHLLTHSISWQEPSQSHTRSENPDRLKPHHQSSNPHAYRNGHLLMHSISWQEPSQSHTRSENHYSTLPPSPAKSVGCSSKKSQGNPTSPASVTCSREVLLEFPSSMPKSAGRSSHSSAAKRSEKSKELKTERNGLNRSLQPAQSLPGLAETSHRDSRPHSADARTRERKTCSLFFIFRRKKKTKEDRSPSPDDRKSHRQNTRERQNHHSHTPQSVSRSEQATSPSNIERRPSSHSSSRPLLTPTSSKPPKTPTSPASTQPNSDRTPQYISRSRPQHRGERRHHHHKHNRTNTPASRTQSEDRSKRALKYEDLPPHPSISKNTKQAVEKSSSQPANTPCSRGSNSRLEQRSANNSVECVSNAKTGAVSSTSLHNLKDSAGGSNPNLGDKSLHSTCKTDPEDDNNCQYTSTSSSDLSRNRSLRSQSLPSFGGDRYIQPDADYKVISDAEDFEFCPSDMKGPLNLSLCGCGFLGMYHLGVVTTLAQKGPSFLEKVQKVGGASAGALMAAVLVTSRDKMEESAEHIQNLAKEIRRKPLGALTPGYSFTRSLRYMLDDILPEDAHELAAGRLYVSLTNVQTKKNELMSDFGSRDELIEALVASCYIPVYAGLKLPTIRGKYFDGGLSDNMPRFETGRTITVSPFDGKSDIGPKSGQEMEKKAHFINFHNQDLQMNINNVKKGAHAFFPPKRHILQEYFEKGRYDASRFLIREGLYEINMQQQQKSVFYESSV